MARQSFSMSSIIVLSIIIVASASDYGYDKTPKGKDKVETYTKPEEYSPQGKDNKLPISYPEYKQPKQKLPYYENPKLEEKEKLINPKKFDYPEYKHPKVEEKKKPLRTKQYYYEQPHEQPPIHTPHYTQPKPHYGGTNKYDLPTTFAVQGLIYYKSGLTYSPLPGAVARITCITIDAESYATSHFTVLSKPCDSKGYFYATISSALEIKECKAYLYSSPSESYNVPTNANYGITGSLLASNYNILGHHNNIKLFSVEPFFYTSHYQPTYNKPAPYNGNGY